MTILYPHRAQHVFRLQRVERQRIGFQWKQVNYRYAVQPQMLPGKAEVMLPALSQHHVDFKPGELSRERDGLQPTQTGEHKFLAKGKVLQQQLVAAETTATLRPEGIIITEPERGEIPVQRFSFHITGHPQP